MAAHAVHVLHKFFLPNMCGAMLWRFRPSPSSGVSFVGKAKVFGKCEFFLSLALVETAV